MKPGKLPEAMLERSVIRQVGHRRREVIAGPAVGVDCAALRADADGIYVLSTDPITAAEEGIGRLAVHVTANDLAASGADPIGVLLAALLPESITEPEIRRIVTDAEQTCQQLNMEILGGHTEITAAVNRPVITVTGIGKLPEGRLLHPSDIRPGDDLIVTKWIGLEATAILAAEHTERLCTRFNADLIDEAAEFANLISVVEDGKIARDAGARAMHDITEGGVFGALWEMAEAAGCGLTADLKAIPIRQETVEICEFFGVNPYQIMSSGSMLIAAPNGQQVVRALQDAGIPASIIGQMTEGNDRILRSGEDVRYLDKPQRDELYKV